MSSTRVGVDYAFPWDGLIAAFKFQGRPELAALLAGLLDPALADAAVDLVLPVPLSAARLRERGFNQAWELARRLARARRLAADAHLLLRVRDTPHQTGLGAEERRRNLRHAFLVEPSRKAALAGRRVALVDDVLTGGATSDEAARTLREAGAAEVQLWVVARTPPPGDD